MISKPAPRARRNPRYIIKRFGPHKWRVTDRLTKRFVRVTSRRAALLWIDAAHAFRLGPS